MHFQKLSHFSFIDVKLSKVMKIKIDVDDAKTDESAKQDSLSCQLATNRVEINR